MFGPKRFCYTERLVFSWGIYAEDIKALSFAYLNKMGTKQKFPWSDLREVHMSIISDRYLKGEQNLVYPLIPRSPCSELMKGSCWGT